MLPLLEYTASGEGLGLTVPGQRLLGRSVTDVNVELLSTEFIIIIIILYFILFYSLLAMGLTFCFTAGNMQLH